MLPIYMYLVLNAGQRCLQCRVDLSLILRVLNAGSLVIFLEVVIIKFRMLHSAVFEEGQPCRTTASVGEQVQIPLFNMNSVLTTPADNGPSLPINDSPDLPTVPDQTVDPTNLHVNSIEPCWSSWIPQPSQARLQSIEYRGHEDKDRDDGKAWATDHPRASFAYGCDDFITCLPFCLLIEAACYKVPHFYIYVFLLSNNHLHVYIPIFTVVISLDYSYSLSNNLSSICLSKT